MLHLLWAALVSAALAIALGLWFRRVDPASVEGYAGCRGWCEGHLNGCGGEHPARVPEQPVNAYTNLIYAAVGVYVALELATPEARVFLLTMLVLCVGSALYHGLSTYRTGRFDVGGMYAVFSALALYAIAMTTGVPPGWTPWVMLAGAALFGLGGFFFRAWYRDSVNWKIAIFLVVVYLVLAERIATHAESDALLPTLVSFGLFALAMLAWQLDRRCKFPLLRWGHGLWHLLTGAAIGTLHYAIHIAA